MAAVGFRSYTPTGTTCGLMVRRTGIFNQFEEDEGQIIAVTPEGFTAPIRVDTLMRSINYVDPSVYDSLSGKVALLEVLRKISPFVKPNILLEGPFQDEGALAEEASASSKGAKRRRFAPVVKLTSDVVAHLFSPFQGSPLMSAWFLRTNEAMAAFADQSRDFKLSAALYDKIVEILSYAPPGATPALGKSSYLQIIPNGIPLSLAPFIAKPPMSPLNPQGDMTTTEEFSGLASMVFDLDGKKIDKSVEKAYEAIIEGANSTQPIDENAVKVLEKVREYLFTKTQDPFTGEWFITDTPAYARYKKCVTDYKLALAVYQATKNSYDLTKPEDQRRWQADSIMLQAKIDSAKNDLDAAGVTVTRALSYLKTHGNNAVQNVLSKAKDNFQNSAVTSQLTTGKFHVSYGFPSTWFSDDSGFSHVSFSTSSFSSNYSREAVSYGGSASFTIGWLSVGGSYSRSEDEERRHVEASNVTFSFALGTIAIERPWMDTTLFSLENWNFGGQPPGKISRGVPPAEDPQLNRRTLAYYPTSFVIAKNVKVTGNWSESDYQLVKQAYSGSASVGIGPFTLSGVNYSRASTSEKFSSRGEGGTFEIPGAQIVGVINTIVPFAAPS